MKLLDKIILYFCDISLFIISLIIIVIPFDLINDNQIIYLLKNIRGNYYITIFGIVLLLITIKPIFYRKKEKRNNEVTMIMNNGDLKISDEAIRGIAESVVLRFHGIKDQKVNVKVKDSKIFIRINGSVIHDINIPSITEEIQKAVIESIENSTGMCVEKVNVEIDKFSMGIPRAKR